MKEYEKIAIESFRAYLSNYGSLVKDDRRDRGYEERAVKSLSH